MAYHLLANEAFGSCEQQANEYKKKCHERFAYADLFREQQQQQNQPQVATESTTS